MNNLKLELYVMNQPIFITNNAGPHEFTKKGTVAIKNVEGLYGKTVPCPVSLMIIPNRTTILLCLN